jgi:hypothetical protein
MIDHGYSFDSDLNHHNIPSYMAHHGTSHESPLHPVAAKWMQGLDEKELEMQLKRHNTPPDDVQAAVRRLQNIKAQYASYPQSSFYRIRQGAMLPHEVRALQATEAKAK